MMTPGPMTDLSGEWAEGLVAGQLLVQQCQDCTTSIMYPKYRCPSCFGADLGWIPSVGMGVLHSFTVLRLGSPSGYEEDLPYAVCIVELDEGVRTLGRLHPSADGTWDAYRCEQRVRFAPIDPALAKERPTPWFDAA